METFSATAVVADLGVAAITLLGVIFTAIMGYYARKNTASINDAVNHRHESQPRLLDLVRTIAQEVAGLKEWQDRWNLPPDLASGAGLIARFTTINRHLDRHAAELREVKQLLAEHAAWEAEKYETLERKT